MMKDEEQAGERGAVPPESTDENPHDQLPTLEEYKANAPSGPPASESKCRTALLISLSLLLLALAGSIALGVVYGKKDDDSPATEPPVFAPDSRVNEVVALVVQQGWSSQSALSDPSSPQRMAAAWMADDDPQNLTLSGTAQFRQRYALVTFYYSTRGDEWHVDAQDDLGWLTARDVCDWALRVQAGIAEARVGVDCHGQTGSEGVVKVLSLAQLGLRGPVPPEIALLEELIDLKLSENEITDIPTELATIPNLENFDVEENDLKGFIPAFIGEMVGLRKLNLAANGYGGEIPSSFVNLTMLTDLDLHMNLLSGTFEALTHVPSAQAIDLSLNMLSGGILPTVLTALTALEVLDLSGNLLNGTIPGEIFSMNELFYLDLHNNSFEGEFPPFLGNDILRYVAIHENNVTGPLDRVVSLTTVQHLDLANNKFTGDIPDDIGEMIFLRYLSLAFNPSLTPGNVTSELGNLRNLVDLSLQETNRVGSIPPELGLMTELRMLDLMGNAMSGDIPSSFSGLSDLRNLLIADNLFEGGLDSTLNLTRLDTVTLYGNSFAEGFAGFCGNLLSPPSDFLADCRLDCPCCTDCCDINSECVNSEWYSDIDPKDQYKFQRQFYVFNPEDVTLALDDDFEDLYDDAVFDEFEDLNYFDPDDP